MDADLLVDLPRLRLVANLGVGFDNVDVAAAEHRGVIVTNTPDVLTEAVAELTVGLALATVRRMVAADRYARAGPWADEGPFGLTGQLSGARVASSAWAGSVVRLPLVSSRSGAPSATTTATNSPTWLTPTSPRRRGWQPRSTSWW